MNCHSATLPDDTCHSATLQLLHVTPPLCKTSFGWFDNMSGLTTRQASVGSLSR